MRVVLRLFLQCLLLLLATSSPAVTPEALQKLAFGDPDEKIVVLGEIAAAADESAIVLLQALADDSVQAHTEKKIVLIVKDGKGIDAATGKAVEPLPEGLDDVVINNRVRGQISSVIAALKLVSPDKVVRLAAAKELQSSEIGRAHV